MLAVIWILLFCLIKAENIDWFKQTSFHNDNLQQIADGWTICPEWEELSESTQLSLFGFDSINTIQLPIKNNSKYNITALCVTIQVPLNWQYKHFTNISNDTSIATINYYISRIFSWFNLNNSNGNGAFWMLQGGPGGAGTTLYPVTIPWMNFIDNTFDLYIPDHRGTGYSNPLNCPTIYSTINITQCISFLDNKFGDDIKYFSTYSAAMDLGYVVDLFQNNLTVYNNNNNTIIWGGSYGTYHLNQYLTLFPNQSNAAIFDSVCDAEQCRFSQFNNRTNDAGLTFLERCTENEFCNNTFKNINTTIFDAIERIFDDIRLLDGDNINGTNNDTLLCVDEYHTDLSSLRRTFASYLADINKRILIAPMIYRIYRCNEDDIKVLDHIFNTSFNITEHLKRLKSNTSNSRDVSVGLYYNIVLSELWDGDNATDPGPSIEVLNNAENTYYFSGGFVARFRLYWDLWNKYIPHTDTFNVFADPPIPMLLLNGELDAQTNIKWALNAAKGYNAVIDDVNAVNPEKRYFFTFPNAEHGVLLTSLIKNYSDTTIGLDDDFKTCGSYVVKSFIDPNNNFIPDTQCMNWLSDIDWEGTSNISKQLSLEIFGTTDVWQIQSTINITTEIPTRSPLDINDTYSPTQSPVIYPTKSPTTGLSKIEEAWFIAGIVFISLFGVSSMIICYLLYLLHLRRRDKYGKTTSYSPRHQQIEAEALQTIDAGHSD